MAESNRFAWVDYYMELADKLKPFSENRAALIEKIKKIFLKIGINLPKLEEDGNVFDIDPFTTFGLFNKGITQENRIKIITAFSDEFSVSAPIPTEFDGIPVLNNQKATFYWFADGRKESDIDNLWYVFMYALEYADKHSSASREGLIQSYDAVLQQKGVKWNISMGLFWIRPMEYINLDGTNRRFISQPEFTSKSFTDSLPMKYKGDTSDTVPSGEEYLKICDDCKSLISTNSFSYKTFPELSAEAWANVKENFKKTKFEKVQESNSQSNVDVLADDTSKDVRYWLYSVFDDESWKECQKKGIMVIGVDKIGDYMHYDSKEDLRQALMLAYQGESSRKNQALMTWSFSRIIKKGDIIFAKRANTLVGRGVVTGDYVFDESRTIYKSVRTVKWLQIGEWEYPGRAQVKRLTDITPYTEYLENLNKIFTPEVMEEDEDTPEIIYPPYTAENFLSEVYMSRKDYEILVAVLKSKKNIILQGAPGVGKTFAAKRLAYSIMGEKDKDRVMMVQFHQSYSYEDFIMGFRPSSTGFELKKGVFYNFCKKAEEDSDNSYFFIIDEINRGNLSKIFGELFMLIETDKRGIELQLLYSDERFSVPENVFIIGLMNTADRSLAMLDYALRRRFSFIDLNPGFETDGFRAYRQKLSSDKFDRLIACIENLNNNIASDESLGEGFCIGHSYFCNLTRETLTDQALFSIVEFEIIPLLKEYWFDEPAKVRDWSSNIRSAIK